jgi:hypothetical protein
VVGEGVARQIGGENGYEEIEGNKGNSNRNEVLVSVSESSPVNHRHWGKLFLFFWIQNAACVVLYLCYFCRTWAREIEICVPVCLGRDVDPEVTASNGKKPSSSVQNFTVF